MSTMKVFYMTFVYRANHEQQRKDLWDDLLNIANRMDEAWCILGDFKAVFDTGDRIGVIEVESHEVKSFRECITICELQEIRSTGPYYTWTNKTVWIRINRALVNAYWLNPFSFSQVTYMPNALLDHTALVVDFPWCPNPQLTFQFCDMWIRDPCFIPLIVSFMSNQP